MLVDQNLFKRKVSTVAGLGLQPCKAEVGPPGTVLSSEFGGRVGPRN